MKTIALLGGTIVSVALVAAPVVTLPQSSTEPTPVEAEVTAVELSQEDQNVTTLDVSDDIAVMGVTWKDQAPDAAAEPRIEVRTLVDGAWGAWTDVSPDSAGPDAGTEEAKLVAQAGAVQGTEPITVLGAQQVQVKTVNVQDVVDLEAQLVDPGESKADEVVVSDNNPAATADAAVLSRPVIVTRAQWGADEKLRGCTPSSASSLKAVTIHHTAGTNSYSASQSPSIMRGIYAYHTQGQKWCDVGYNLLVDKYGTVFEGRYGSLNSNVIGAHSSGFNTGTLGVSVMGNYETAAFPAAAKRAMERAIAWKMSINYLDPATNVTLTGGGGSSKYKSGSSVRVPSIFAHRDVGYTTCPGRYIYSQMDSIRANVKKMVGTVTPPAPPAPAIKPVTPPSNYQVLSGNWSGSGKDEAGTYANGKFTLTVNGRPTVIRFGRVTDRPIVGDWNGDGKDEIGVVRSNNQWFLRSSLASNATTKSFIYGTTSGTPFVGKWNGKNDGVGMRFGNQFHLRNTMSAGRAEHVFNWGRASMTPVPGDWNGDGKDTMGLHTRGQWFLGGSDLRRPEVGKVAYAFGTTMNRPTSGDWNGDRRDTPGTALGSYLHSRDDLRGGGATRKLVLPFL